VGRFECSDLPLDALADGFFVLVRRGRIDQAVAGLDRVVNAAFALGQIAHLEHSEAEDRHLHAVVEFDTRCSWGNGQTVPSDALLCDTFILLTV
jgi:hypothetical protein